MSKEENGGLQLKREVVCIVFLKDGNVLLEERLDDDNFKHKWTFPGGKIDPVDYVRRGSAWKHAAIRESLEETGLVPKATSILVSFEEFSENGQRFLFHGVWVKGWEGALQNKEPDRRNLAWVPLEQAAGRVAGVRVDSRILQAFLDVLNK